MLLNRHIWLVLAGFTEKRAAVPPADLPFLHGATASTPSSSSPTPVDVCTAWNGIFNVSGAHSRCSDLDNVKNAPTWSQRGPNVPTAWGCDHVGADLRSPTTYLQPTQGAPDIGPTLYQRGGNLVQPLAAIAIASDFSAVSPEQSGQNHHVKYRPGR